MSGHTPGPWEAIVLGSEGYAVMGPPYEGRRMRRRVARCGDTDWEQDKANAYLIASVPTMLANLAALNAALTALIEDYSDAACGTTSGWWRARLDDLVHLTQPPNYRPDGGH